MRTRSRKYLLLVALVALTPFLSACGLLRGSHDRGGSAAPDPVQANPGEREGTIPAAAPKEAPPAEPGSLAAAGGGTVRRQLTSTGPTQTLPSDEARLAAGAVGEARTVERAGAAAGQPRHALSPRAHIYNSGTVVGVSQAIGGAPGEWVVVTREQTGGDQEYAGLQAAFHVTLATVQAVPGGWAVAAWRPQS